MISTTSTMQPSVIILVQNSVPSTPDDEHFEKTFRKKAVKILSKIQIASFFVALVSQVTLDTKFKFGMISYTFIKR